MHSQTGNLYIRVQHYNPPIRQGRAIGVWRVGPEGVAGGPRGWRGCPSDGQKNEKQFLFCFLFSTLFVPVLAVKSDKTNLVEKGSQIQSSKNNCNISLVGTCRVYPSYFIIAIYI